MRHMKEFNESETQKSEENVKEYSDRRESFQNWKIFINSHWKTITRNTLILNEI